MCIRDREEEYQAGLDSFSREAQMLAALGNFPSVVQVLDCFQANGTAYLVMEYLSLIHISHRFCGRAVLSCAPH